MKPDEALKVIVDLIQNSADFAKQQLPDVVQQKIAYTVWSDWLGIKIVLVVLAILLMGSIISITVKKYNDYNVIFVVLFLIGVAGGGIIVGSNYLEIVKVQKAPKAYAVEYLSTLVK